MSPSSWYKTFMAKTVGAEVGSYRPSGSKPGPPMDLTNMRENGVRDLSVLCRACGHTADVNVDAYSGHLSVPSFASRIKCSKCDSRNISVRPNWRNRPPYIPAP
jgi:hypothetical protein